MDILPCLKGQVKILGFFFFSEEEKIKEFFGCLEGGVV